MATKYQTFYVTVGAGATLINNPATVDDNQDRTLTGILAGNTTAQVHDQVKVAGKLIADIDHSIYSPAASFIPLSYVFKGGIQFEVDVINGTGGSVGPFAIVLRYEVPM